MTTTTVRGPADVIGLLPYQLGYHPHDAVVAVSVSDRRLGMIARVDLPAEEHRDEAAAHLVEPLDREGAEGVVLIGYETVAGASVPMLDALDRACSTAGIEVMDVITVCDDHWRSLRCAQPCCDPPGRPVADATTIPAVSEYVGLGVAPLPDRAALERLLATDPDTTEVASALARLRASWPDATGTTGAGGGPDRVDDVGMGGRSVPPDEGARRRRVRSAWRRLCDLGDGAVTVEDLSTDDVAVLADSLDDVAWRDAVVARLCPGTLSLDELPPGTARAVVTAIATRPWCEGGDERARAVAGRRLLTRLAATARRVPTQAAPPFLTVYANLAWWCGDGSMARVALDRALEIDPDYRLAQLLGRLVELAIRPSRARPAAPGTGDS